MDLKITPSGQTIVKPTALGPGANTDTKLLIYGLFQKGRVLAQDGIESVNALIEERCAEVDHWKTSNQRQRWLATALTDIEPRLRKVMGTDTFQSCVKRSSVN